MLVGTIQQLLAEAKPILAVVTDQPQLDAEILLANCLHQTRSYLYAWPDKQITPEQTQQFYNAIERRCAGEPVAYITGHKEFWSLDFIVSPDVLIPRPETELLVETALACVGETNQPIKLADLGTGSGAVALAIASERPHWHIFAVDVSENALHIASKNAQRLALNNVSFHQGNWCTALPSNDFNIIVANPPYIAESEWEAYAAGLKYEPRMALTSGSDGLDAIRCIAQQAKDYLCKGAYLLLEHGFTQGLAVRDIVSAEGYDSINTFTDLSGQERIAVARR